MATTIMTLYDGLIKPGDPRVEDWLLMKTPIPITIIFVLYLALVFLGPKIMSNRKPVDLKYFIIVYNLALVYLSVYMFYEFLVTSTLAGYSYICQPVDYSSDPLALRMANVCWWFFFSKVIELLDTLFFILRKKNDQVTFLHVYHHCTMIINWWAGAKYVAGGQSFFLAMLNSCVHIFMYSYYGLAALGPHMQKYLWWKKHLTKLQLIQFVGIIVHTGTNMYVDCDFPSGFNYAVFFYAISLIILFSNFYLKAYIQGKRTHDKSHDKSPDILAKEMENGDYGDVQNSNGIRKRVK